MNLNVVGHSCGICRYDPFRLTYPGGLWASGHHLCWAWKASVVQVLELSFGWIIEFTFFHCPIPNKKGMSLLPLPAMSSASFFTVSSTQGWSWSGCESRWFPSNVWQLEGHLLQVKYKLLFKISSKSSVKFNFFLQEKQPPYLPCEVWYQRPNWDHFVIQRWL